MKIACPSCRKVLKAPNGWAGKTVRCPQCKQRVTLPREPSTDSSGDFDLDLGSLATIESAGEVVITERAAKPMTLKEAQAAAAAATAGTGPDTPQKADPTLRTCPQCRQQVRVADPYSEVLCRHCGGGIPGLEFKPKKGAGYKAVPLQIRPQVSFYGGFTGAVFYPLPAMGAIAAGMGIALGIIALPLTGLLGFLSVSSLNEAAKQDPNLGWVGPFLSVMFIAEGIYFGSVAYYALIDSIRSTLGGNEHPPPLTWNITKLGAALGGYAALVGFYLLVVLVMLLASGHEFPTSAGDLRALGGPVQLSVLALLTFSLPMNLIGLASNHALDGLNPIRVFVSIGRLLGHYIFLFLIALIYLGIYVGIMYAVMNWAGPAIMDAAREGIKEGYVSVLIGIGAWAVVMGLGFYFAYCIGRILGLFARTFRERIEFE